MDCRTALEILDCQGLGVADLPREDVREGLASGDRPGVNPPEADLAAAVCTPGRAAPPAGRLWERLLLDRKIGRTLRAVNVPRDSLERLIAQLVTLEAAAKGHDGCRKQPERGRHGGARPRAAGIRSPDCDDLKRTGRTKNNAAVVAADAVPIAACVALAAIGFFSVVWLLTPCVSIDDVSQQLARLDFESLETP